MEIKGPNALGFVSPWQVGFGTEPLRILTMESASFPLPRGPLSLIPTRLTRYVLIEILKIFLVSLIALTMLILLIGVGRELLRRGLGMVAIIQLLPYVLPISLQFAFPATALFSVCCVYGRMAADGEVATVKASGISPLKLLQPAFVFAALLSPVAVFVSDLAVSWGRPGINRVVLMSIEDIAYRFLENQHYYDSGQGFSIHVQDVVGRKMIRPSVSIQNSRQKVPIKLSAAEGELRLDPETHELVLYVVDTQIEAGNEFQGIIPKQGEFPIPLAEALAGRSVNDQSPSELPMNVLGQESVAQDNRNHIKVGEVAAHTGFSILTCRLDEIAGGQGRQLEQTLRTNRKRLVRLQTEPWRRWAWGFSCFFFVFVGAPLAMIAKTSDYWSTFGLCFLPTLIVYYPLFIFGLEQAKDGHLPPYGVWMGNAILVMIGTVLVARVRRY